MGGAVYSSEGESSNLAEIHRPRKSVRCNAMAQLCALEEESKMTIAQPSRWTPSLTVRVVTALTTPNPQHSNRRSVYTPPNNQWKVDLVRSCAEQSPLFSSACKFETQFMPRRKGGSGHQPRYPPHLLAIRQQTRCELQPPLLAIGSHPALRAASLQSSSLHPDCSLSHLPPRPRQMRKREPWQEQPVLA